MKCLLPGRAAGADAGFKMVKWVQAIEFVEDVRSVEKGEGGFAEDHDYFGELANM